MKSNVDQTVEVEGISTPPQDTMADFNLFSVLPQEEEENVEPPPTQNTPTEQEPQPQPGR